MPSCEVPSLKSGYMEACVEDGEWLWGKVNKHVVHFLFLFGRKGLKTKLVSWMEASIEQAVYQLP